MSVYVDGERMPFGRMTMCHMLADTDEELHAMADRIGVSRVWFQNKNPKHHHYDVCLAKRALAVRFGALEISRKELVAILKRRNSWGKTAVTSTSKPRARSTGSRI